VSESRTSDDLLTLADVDADGALREAFGQISGMTRARFIGTLSLGSAALLAAMSPDAARAAPGRDQQILNFALVLEYLQASFYTEAERRAQLKGTLAQIPPQLGAVERAHVSAFRRALGSAAVKRPFFNFGGTTEQANPFLRTAVAFEDLAVAAYKGQAPRIQSPSYLAAAISIHSVEARHAAWMRYLFGKEPAAAALDEPISAARARRLVASTHFIVSKAQTAAGGTPKYSG
jgi:rubrerythrin